MGLLKTAVKFKAAKKITNKAIGGGVLGTAAAVKMTKKSNQRARNRRLGK